MTLIRRPRLRGPVLLAAFDGWNDAGEAATSALDAIGDGLGAETFATLDPEEFYDFQATRPTVRLVEGLRRIEWPAVELRAARLPAAEHDLIVVRGHEPNLRWRTFAAEIVELAADLRVEMVVTVGALLADVPHTRPVQVVSSAGDKDLAERLGLNVSRYEGPTGILGVLGEAATSEGIPTVGLWAALPHYLNLAPNPWGAMALVKELRRLLPMAVDTSALAGQTEAFDAAVADLVEENPELAGYIERLEADSDEEEVDEEGSPGLADVPPEELVAEVERYLRDHPGGTRAGVVRWAPNLASNSANHRAAAWQRWRPVPAPTKEAAAAWNPSSRRPAGESRTCSSASIPAAPPTRPRPARSWWPPSTPSPPPATTTRPSTRCCAPRSWASRPTWA